MDPSWHLCWVRWVQSAFGPLFLGLRTCLCCGVFLLDFRVSSLPEGKQSALRSHSKAVGWGHFWGLQVPSPVCSTVGPCALEYTKMKTADHFWTDPSADELVQRHRIHSSHLRQDSPTKRPALCVRWVGSVRASNRVWT